MTRKFTGDTLVVATHNNGKLEEIASLIRPFSVSVKGAAELNLAEPDETETSFVGNARIKAHAAAQATGLPSLSDDSGIEIDALDGAPGVYTADWAETPNGRDFVLAMTKANDLLDQRGVVLGRLGAIRCQGFEPGLGLRLPPMVTQCADMGLEAAVLGTVCAGVRQRQAHQT